MTAAPTLKISVRSSPAGSPPPTSSHGVPSSSAFSVTWARPSSVSVNSLRPPDSVGADEPLVLELRERRVDRAGARPPGAAAARLDLLHQPVAVARLLGQQDEQGGADVAAARARARRPKPGPNGGRRSGRRGAVAGAGRGGRGAGHREPEGERVDGLEMAAPAAGHGMGVHGHSCR